MQTGRADIIVFAKDYPEIRLVVEVRSSVETPPERDSAVQQVSRYMWGSNCHFGLIVAPLQTYVLRDDFSQPGPESIRVTDILSTSLLLSRSERTWTPAITPREFEELVRDWVERLASSYESALPDDSAVEAAFFPDIVGAVANGRVVSEVPV